MASPPIPDSVLDEMVAAVAEHGGNVTNAADALGLARGTLQNRLRAAKRRGLTRADEAPVDLPEFPDDDIDTERIIQSLEKRFSKRSGAAAARKWFKVKVNIDGPFGIMWYGDPHLDSNGCNWPLLRKHIALHKKCDALLGAGLGDYSDNWTGRLIRLYADADTSKHTARKLVKWFLQDAGVPWFLFIMGNHDLWNDGDALLREMNVNRIVMEDRAQFRLVPPNGQECRIWVEHDFKGHSMWNTLHAAQKAAHMKEMAHLYVSGHKHNWALHHEESASRGFCYWLARTRGYKYIDDFSESLGHFPQEEGASIVSIHDPNATSMAGFVQCFADPEEATDYLIFKRKKAKC